MFKKRLTILFVFCEAIFILKFLREMESSTTGTDKQRYGRPGDSSSIQTAMCAGHGWQATANLARALADRDARPMDGQTHP